MNLRFARLSNFRRGCFNFAEGLDVKEVSSVLTILLRGDAEVLPLPLCIFRLPGGSARSCKGCVSAFARLAPLRWDVWRPNNLSLDVCFLFFFAVLGDECLGRLVGDGGDRLRDLSLLACKLVDRFLKTFEAALRVLTALILSVEWVRSGLSLDSLVGKWIILCFCCDGRIDFAVVKNSALTFGVHI